MPVTQNRDRPPKAKAFYAYSYNHAHRLALEKLYMELSRSPTDFFNHFWIQVAVSLLQPPHGGFRSETAVT